MANALRFLLCSIILTWFHLLKNGREGLKLAGIKDGFQEVEKPFPSSSGSPYQNEIKCYAFDMEWYLQGIFHSHANKTHFHKKGCALGFWNSEAAYFPLENSDRETRTSFSNVPLLPEICHWNDPKSHVSSINVARLLACVAGVRKGRGRELGRETAREGGGRRFLSFLPRASQALSRTQIPASPFNACHAGYTLASIHNFNNLSSKDIFPSWGS